MHSAVLYNSQSCPYLSDSKTQQKYNDGFFEYMKVFVVRCLILKSGTLNGKTNPIEIKNLHDMEDQTEVGICEHIYS